MHYELKDVSRTLFENIKAINSDSFLVWVGGTAISFWKNEEVRDYDFVVSGISKSQLSNILKSEFSIINYDEESTVLNARTDSGKFIDVSLFGSFVFDINRNNWSFDENYFDYVSTKDSVDPRDLMKTILKTGAGRFSNRSLCYIFPEMKPIIKDSWLEDLKKKRTEVLRSESRYVFYDYMRLFRFSSMGYDIKKKTYRWMVENSLIEYLVWKDRKVSPDRISEYQDSLLKYILRVYNQEDRISESKPENFFNLCVETSLFSSLLGYSPEKVDRNQIKSPEEFLLNIYGSKKSIEKEIGKHHIYKTGYFE